MIINCAWSLYRLVIKILKKNFFCERGPILSQTNQNRNLRNNSYSSIGDEVVKIEPLGVCYAWE